MFFLTSGSYRFNNFCYYSFFYSQLWFKCIYNVFKSLSTVRSYDKHDKCGLVWIPRVVAYRCRTCGISPCMSICRDCFHRGDHSTHDFNMFLSQAGGACDCGDNSVMKEDGWVQWNKDLNLLLWRLTYPLCIDKRSISGSSLNRNKDPILSSTHQVRVITFESCLSRYLSVDIFL